MIKKRILLIDDEPSVTRHLKLNLEATARYEVCTENDSSHAVQTAREFDPDLIFLDVLMPGLDGGDVSARIHSDPQLKDTPIVFLTSLATKEDTTGQAVQEGSTVYLAKPANIEEVIKCIETHARRRSTNAGSGSDRKAADSHRPEERASNNKIRILVIDDEASVTRSIRLNLEVLGTYEVRTENQARQAVQTAREFRPDLILLDVMMPELDGGDIAAQLQEDPLLEDTPIVFLTAIVSKEETKGREAHIGGLNYLAKPVDLVELTRVIEAHLKV